MAGEAAVRAQRVDIGFSGGQVLSVRMQESAYEELRKALSGASESAGWHELRTEDSELSLHLAQVVYVRLDTEKHKVGFQMSDIQVPGAVLRALDVAVLRAFRTRAHTPSRERAIAAFSRLGEQAFLWFAVCAAGALVDPGNRPVYGKAARTVLGTYACNQLIKAAVRRRRPRLPDLPPLAGTLSGLSYPSAHAATSFAGARMLSPALPATPLYATAVGLSLSRLYLGLHYPTDVAAGAALGASIAELRS